MKYKDLEEKDQKDLSDLIYNKEYDPNYRKSENSFTKGLCKLCLNYEFAKSEFNIAFSFCKSFDIKIRSADPILECSSYINKHIMSLNEMKDIAYLIDNKEKKIGF